MSRSDSTAARLPTPALGADQADTGWRCLGCAYNLTGVSGANCPECGIVIDRESVARVAAGKGLSTSPFDRGANPWRFVQTFGMAILAPWKLADSISVAPDLRRAMWYRIVAYMLAAVPMTEDFVRDQLTSAAAFRDLYYWAVIISVSWCCAYLCESSICLVWMVLTRPSVGVHRFRICRATTAYFSGALILSGVWLWLELASYFKNDEWLWNAELVNFWWWSAALAIALSRNVRFGLLTPIAWGMIPAIGAGAYWLGRRIVEWATF